MMRVRFLTAAAVCFLVTILVPARASAQSEVVEYYALDAIGSVRVVFDVNGGIKSRRDYAPFGEVVSSIAADPKMYAQLFRDDESTLDYAQARMYQSGTGRFTAVDPVYAGLFAPQKWNRYAYALNNQLTFVDVNGMDPCGLNRWCVETVDQYLRHSGGGGGTDLMYVVEDTKVIGIVEFDEQSTGLPSAPSPISTPTPPTIPTPTPEPNLKQDQPARETAKDSNSLLSRVGHCLSENFGLTAATAASAAGAAPISKKWLEYPVLPGASTHTNPISLLGHKFPFKSPVRLMGTTNLIRIVGRANPYVAVGLAAYDAYSIGSCVVR